MSSYNTELKANSEHKQYVNTVIANVAVEHTLIKTIGGYAFCLDAADAGTSTIWSKEMPDAQIYVPNYETSVVKSINDKHIDNVKAFHMTQYKLFTKGLPEHNFEEMVMCVYADMMGQPEVLPEDGSYDYRKSGILADVYKLFESKFLAYRSVLAITACARSGSLRTAAYKKYDNANRIKEHVFDCCKKFGWWCDLHYFEGCNSNGVYVYTDKGSATMLTLVFKLVRKNERSEKELIKKQRVN